MDPDWYIDSATTFHKTQNNGAKPKKSWIFTESYLCTTTVNFRSLNRYTVGELLEMDAAKTTAKLIGSAVEDVYELIEIVERKLRAFRRNRKPSRRCRLRRGCCARGL
jgi:hypothetical protein